MKISVLSGKNKGKRTKLGIGPILATLSISYCLIAFFVTRQFGQLFYLSIIPEKARIAVGLFLLLGGIPFYIISVISMLRAYGVGRLNTTGVFACCRNPIYAAWIVFMVPGMAFLVDSWLLLTAPFIMYLFLKILIENEEQYLEEMFGDEYLEYKKNIPEVLPVGWFC